MNDFEFENSRDDFLKIFRDNYIKSKKLFLKCYSQNFQF